MAKPATVLGPLTGSPMRNRDPAAVAGRLTLSGAAIWLAVSVHPVAAQPTATGSHDRVEFGLTFGRRSVALSGAQTLNECGHPESGSGRWAFGLNGGVRIIHRLRLEATFEATTATLAGNGGLSCPPFVRRAPRPAGPDTVSIDYPPGFPSVVSTVRLSLTPWSRQGGEVRLSVGLGRTPNDRQFMTVGAVNGRLNLSPRLAFVAEAEFARYRVPLVRESVLYNDGIPVGGDGALVITRQTLSVRRGRIDGSVRIGFGFRL